MAQDITILLVVCNQMPFVHSILERVLPYTVKEVLKVFILEKQLFSLEALNGFFPMTKASDNIVSNEFNCHAVKFIKYAI